MRSFILILLAPPDNDSPRASEMGRSRVVENLYFADCVDLTIWQPLLSTTWQGRHQKPFGPSEFRNFFVVDRPLALDLQERIKFAESSPNPSG
jgi:hypothetical protein